MNYHASPNSLTTIHPVQKDQSPRPELPNNLEAEQALLGAILINNNAYDRVSEFLKPSHFFEPLHGRIYEVAATAIAMKKVANPVTIKTFLPADDKVGDLTISQYLARLAADAVSIINAEDYGRAIYDLAVRRSLIQIGEEMIDEALNAPMDVPPQSQIDNAERQLNDLVQTGRSATGRQILPPGEAYLEMFNAAVRGDARGVPIGLAEVRKVLSESFFEAGNLYGLLSSSGEGKTSLTLQLMHHVIKAGHPVQFLSYDQSAGQCVRQMISQVHGIGVAQQNNARDRMTDRERDICVKFATDMNRMPLEIIRCQREGVGQLCAYTRRFEKRHRHVGLTPMIIIDHIGKIKPRDPKLSPDRISGEVTVELKALADELGVTFFVLNQRNTFGTRRDNPRPIAADLYGGEGARADYDAVLYLYYPGKYKKERLKTVANDADRKKITEVFGNYEDNDAEIGAIKVRFGSPNEVEVLTFEPSFTRYASKPNSYDRGMFQ